MADEERDTHNLAVVLAEQTARALQGIDLVLQEAQAMVAAAGVTDEDQYRQQMGTYDSHRFLRDRLRSLPQANAIELIDNAGKIVGYSRGWPALRIDLSERDYVTYWRDHAGTGVVIGAPVVDKITGTWVMTISRRISGPRGEFLGIVAGVTESRYFEDFYKVLTANEGRAVSLFRRDGTLLARQPHVEDKIGRKIPTTSPWYDTLANGGGTFRTVGYIGELPRIVSAQPITDYPLAVTVGASEAVALAPWRRQSLMIAIAALGVVLGAAILFRILAVQFFRLEQNAARLEQNAVELTQKTTELEEAATELKRSNTELEQFAYVASHDLQEPLRMVTSYCQLLQRRYGDKLGEDGAEFIAFAVDGAGRMTRLIKDLLAYSRVGRIGGSFEPLDMNGVVDGALANLAGAIAEGEARIERGPLPRIVGERVQLAQLFQNLIGNAIKFRRDEPPVIRVTASDNGDGMTRFLVEDNGIGIPEEHLERAFVIFQRLHEREKYAGTGIGLAIAKKVVEYHGGRIWIESTVGEGTRFNFTLPTAGDADELEESDVPAVDQRQRMLVS
ncbi:MAG TPA: ATP-binding protein [Stellaceae bacterium]|nr:ATP-binding protein [Stellaceae bacterium]